MRQGRPVMSLYTGLKRDAYGVPLVPRSKQPDSL